MAEPLENPLVSSKPSDTGTTVSLHPLVLLTASDQITRYRVRSEKEPLVGIILGQQKGREITAEHAFVAGLVKTEAGQYTFKQPWLETRIQQCKSAPRD
jgi:COP9 signalosome complex subunit 6